VAFASLAACGHGDAAPSQDAAAACVPGPDGDIGGPPPDNCPNDLPTDMDCPDASPSYQNQIAEIISNRCSVCHRLGGLESSKLFDTYDQVHTQRVTMLNFIYHCQMPPTCAVPLTAEERAELLKWFVCKAMDN
jgi:hypothetical protein